MIFQNLLCGKFFYVVSKYEKERKRKAYIDLLKMER